MKYKLLRPYQYGYLTDYKLKELQAGTIGETTGCGDLIFKTDDDTFDIRIEPEWIEANPEWFEKIEEPYISKQEMYWYVSSRGTVIDTPFYPSYKQDNERLEIGNLFPTRLFTRQEVESIAEEVKAIFKKHQNSKQ